MNSRYCGANWFKTTYPKRPMSPIGVKVADILGHVFQGLYHIDEKTLKKVDWADTHCIILDLRKSLSTWDFCDLTDLVILCHDECVRLEISAHTFNLMRLMFHPRERTGDMSRRHPTIEAQIQRVRAATNPQPEGAT